VRSGRVTPIDSMAPLSEADIAEVCHLVGQMGAEAFCRALHAGADVVIVGRACDTAIFAAVPALLGCAMGPAMHMAKTRKRDTEPPGLALESQATLRLMAPPGTR
jgi:hypothetical protein